MAIWDFDLYATDELYHIQKCNEELKNYALGIDEEAEFELNAEIDKRETESED